MAQRDDNDNTASDGKVAPDPVPPETIAPDAIVDTARPNIGETAVTSPQPSSPREPGRWASRRLRWAVVAITVLALLVAAVASFVSHGRIITQLRGAGMTIETRPLLVDVVEPYLHVAVRCDAEGAAITDRDLRLVGRLVTLRSVDLSGTAITNAGLVYLHDLSDLETLDLRDTAVNAEGVASLGEHLPDTAIRHAAASVD